MATKPHSPRGPGSKTWQLPPLSEAERAKENRLALQRQVDRGLSHANYVTRLNKSQKMNGSPKRIKSPKRGGKRSGKRSSKRSQKMRS
jgi:hypothetical protein